MYAHAQILKTFLAILFLFQVEEFKILAHHY